MRQCLCAWLLASLLPALGPGQSMRRLTGTVLLPNGKPAQGSIVTLENETGEIRTAISTPAGWFQFSSLFPDVGYQVRARLGELESNRVKWTRWSSRTEKDIILRLRHARTAEQAGSSDRFRIGSIGFGLDSDLNAQGRRTITRLRNHDELTLLRRSACDVRRPAESPSLYLGFPRLRTLATNMGSPFLDEAA